VIAPDGQKYELNMRDFITLTEVNPEVEISAFPEYIAEKMSHLGISVSQEYTE
jgi:hypothetical protein